MAQLDVPIWDTHEHLEPESFRISRQQDPMAVFLFHYLSTDFFSAGLSPEDLAKLRDASRPWGDRWQLFEQFWDYAKTTGYGQAIKIAIRDLYGIEDITKDTYPKLAEMMKQASVKGFYKSVLEKANIEKVILDHGEDIRSIESFDRSTFGGVIRFESLVHVKSLSELRRASLRMGTPIHSLSDYESAFRKYVRQVLPGFAGVKTSILAYEYSLKIDYVTFSDAEYALKAIVEGNGHEMARDRQPSLNELKPLHDYMFRVLLDEVGKSGKPIQIHTGIQEDGPGGDPPVNALQNSNPTLLVNLFREFPEVKFILFHASYPYSREAGVLAKQWPNVYLDMCWVSEINPKAYEDVLSEWLELVPNNKIMAFGGDYIFIEGTYGASRVARRGVARVVQEKVDRGHWDKEDAEKVTWRILRENAKRLLGATQTVY
ncbi:MAG: amidohydrolase family protein [Thermoprotei archaeon]|jgi:hypothetical protein